MHEAPDRPPSVAVRWPIPIMLAAPALGIALAITFSADHSAQFGLIVVGLFALLTAIAAGGAAALSGSGAVRSALLVKAAIGVVTGTAAILSAFAATGPDPIIGTSTLAIVTAGTLLFLGAVDAWLGFRTRGDRFARDWNAGAIIAVVTAIVVMLVPPDFHHAFTGPDGVERHLTASIVIVGVTGAGLAILGVFYAIAGASLIPQRTRPRKARA